MHSALVLAALLQVPSVAGSTPASWQAQDGLPAASPSLAPVAAFPAGPRVRLADLVEIDGVRDNQLFGTGVVVGLNGTGDGSTATKQALANFIRRTQLNVDLASVVSSNAALVSITANLGKFPAVGTKMDVQVQSIGDAKSLFGGVLLQAPLLGADGKAYVVAQGPVTVGGYAVGGEASSVTVNHPQVGIVADGGIVERTVDMDMIHGGRMHLHLVTPNYETAARVADALDLLVPGGAVALNQRTIRLQVPLRDQKDPVGFFAKLGRLEVTPGEEAVVVINSRTGTIVAGQHVRITTTSVTHGNLTVRVTETPLVSQPEAFSLGETEVVPRTDVQLDVENREMQVLDGGTSALELANALNRLGVTSRDMVSIFLALKRSGHLHARLEVM